MLNPMYKYIHVKYIYTFDTISHLIIGQYQEI